MISFKTTAGPGGPMHSHDQTMIARLGFADADRRDAEHDLACRYLTQEEIAERLIGAVVGPRFAAALDRRIVDIRKDNFDMKGTPRDPPTYRDVRADPPTACLCGAKTEVPLLKGEGKYATTLGFLDVRIGFYASAPIRMEKSHVSYQYDGTRIHYQVPGATSIVTWKEIMETFSMEGEITVEVKIGKVGLGEAIRQIKFYRSFSGAEMGEFHPHVLATRYEITQQEAEALANERIEHIHLGEKFTEWMEGAEKEKSPSTTSIRL